MNKLINLDQIRHEGNVRINTALTNKWLDKETIQSYVFEQTMLQRYPFLLHQLANRIRKEIRFRVLHYGT